MKPLFLLLVFSVVFLSHSFAQDRYVNRLTGVNVGACNLPGSPCQTIQYAVNQAVAGDRINIASGNYSGNVSVNKSLTFLGAKQGLPGYEASRGSSESRISGSVTLVAGTNNVTFDGMFIFGNAAAAITAPNVSNLTIKNSLLYAKNAGSTYYNCLTVTDGSQVTLDKNRFGVGKVAISLTNTTLATITDNVFGVLVLNNPASDIITEAGIDIKDNCGDIRISANHFIQVNANLVRLQVSDPNGLVGKVSIRNNFMRNTGLGINIIDGTSPWNASLVEIIENYFVFPNNCLYAGSQNTTGGKIYANANYWGAAQAPTRGFASEAITGTAQTDVDALLWFYNPVDVSTALGFQSNKKLSFDPAETSTTLQPAVDAVPRPVLPLLERWELRPSFLGNVTFVEDVMISIPMFLEGTYNTFKTNINSGGTLPQVVKIVADSVLFRAFNLNIDNTTPRGIVVEGVEETEILANTFNQQATNGQMLVVDSKKAVAPFVTNTIKIQNNNFLNSGFGGTAIKFLNTNKGISGQPSPEFGLIDVSSNTFEEPYDYFFFLDPTVGKEFTLSPSIANNTFTVNSITDIPANFTDETALFLLENKLLHKIDVPTVGFLTVKANNYYVTPQSFLAPFTTTPDVQRAINLASSTNTIHIAGTNYPNADYPNNVSITQPLTFDMEDSQTPLIQGLTMNIAGGGTLSVLGNLGLRNSLTLTEGYITPNTGGNITFAPNFSSVIGATNTSYINGTVKIDKTGVGFPTSFTAPIGDGAGKYRPLSLSGMSGTNPVFSIFTSTNLTGATKDLTFNNFAPKPVGASNRFWSLTMESGSISTPGTLVARYGAGEGIDASTQTLAALAYSTTKTGVYTSITTTPGGTAIPEGTITANPTSITATNFFTISIQCGGIIPAPTLTVAGATVDICENKDLTLSISSPNAANTYYWSGVGIPVNYTGTSVTIPKASLGSVGNMQNYTVYFEDTFGCTSQNKVITAKVVAQPVATFNYSASGYCQTASNPTPTTTTAGGTFSASPAGLVFVSISTGEINLSASAIGIYTISYNIAANGVNSCDADTKTQTVTIANPATATISTTETLVNTNELRYCSGSFTLNASARADYSYQWKRNGTDIPTETNASITTAIAGDYTVVILNPCGNATSNIIKLIQVTPTAFFAYSKTNFCSTETNPSPTTTPTAGGTYSVSPTGLTLNPTTGQVDLATSSLGNYTITYTLTGASQGVNCANQQTSVSFNVATPATATISTTATLVNTNELRYCSGSFTLNVSTRADYSYQWKRNGTDIPTETNASITIAISGDYTVVVTNTCGSVTSNIIKLIQVTPTAVFAYSKINFCSTEANPSPTTTPTAGGTYSVSPAGLTLNATTGQVDLATSTVGNYTITYTLTGASQGVNCANQQTSVSFNISTPATAIISTTATVTNTNEVNFCSGSVVFSAATRVDYSYQWQRNSVNIPSETASTITTSTAGDYRVVITNNCGSVNSNILKIVPVTLSANFSYSKSNFCSNETNPTPTVTSTGGVFSATPSGLSFDASTGTINLTATTSGAYVVTYTVGGASGGVGCTVQTQTFNITVNPPAAAATISTTTPLVNNNEIYFCSGSVILTSTTRPDYVYQWQRNNLDISGATTSTLTVTQSGDYKVNITNTCGLVSSNIIRLVPSQNANVTSIDISPDFKRPLGENVTLKANISNLNVFAPNATYEWKDPEGNAVGDNNAQITFPLTKSGVYTVTIKNGFGCEITVPIATPLEILPVDLFVPTAFSPNGNGDVKNEKFLVYGGFGIQEISFKIFDRTGVLLYETNNLQDVLENGWDGTKDGKPMPAGTYVWNISGRKLNGEAVTAKGKNAGTVLLIR